jgi:GNAT superfamily N-acetyltransferase
MIELIPFEIKYHKEDFILLNYETMNWHFEEFQKNYKMDLYKVMGKTPMEIAEASIETYRDLMPPNGIFYLGYVDGQIAGMGAIRKIDESLGEIKRMWNRTLFRGMGLGKKIVYSLLEKGVELGCSWFGLNTPKFAYAAHRLYESVGFKFVDSFPEVDIGETFRPYYLFMEKNSNR